MDAENMPPAAAAPAAAVPKARAAVAGPSSSNYSMLQRACLELLSTERNYLECLHVLFHRFLTPLCNGKAKGVSLESAAKTAWLACHGASESLLNLHVDLSGALHDIAVVDGDVKQPHALNSAALIEAIAAIFQRHAGFFLVYIAYINIYLDCTEQVAPMSGGGGVVAPSSKKNASHRAFMKWQEDIKAEQTKAALAKGEQINFAQTQSLQSLLIMPVQRVLRYGLLLKNISDEYDKEIARTAAGNDADDTMMAKAHEHAKAQLKDALSKVNTQSKLLNEKQREKEGDKRLASLHDSLKGLHSGYVLLESHRKYMLDARVFQLHPRPSAARKPLHLWLTSDVLVLQAESSGNAKAWIELADVLSVRGREGVPPSHAAETAHLDAAHIADRCLCICSNMDGSSPIVATTARIAGNVPAAINTAVTSIGSGVAPSTSPVFASSAPSAAAASSMVDTFDPLPPPSRSTRSRKSFTPQASKTMKTRLSRQFSFAPINVPSAAAAAAALSNASTAAASGTTPMTIDNSPVASSSTEAPAAVASSASMSSTAATLLILEFADAAARNAFGDMLAKAQAHALHQNSNVARSTAQCGGVALTSPTATAGGAWARASPIASPAPIAEEVQPKKKQRTSGGGSPVGAQQQAPVSARSVQQQQQQQQQQPQQSARRSLGGGMVSSVLKGVNISVGINVGGGSMLPPPPSPRSPGTNTAMGLPAGDRRHSTRRSLSSTFYNVSPDSSCLPEPVPIEDWVSSSRRQTLEGVDHSAIDLSFDLCAAVGEADEAEAAATAAAEAKAAKMQDELYAALTTEEEAVALTPSVSAAEAPTPVAEAAAPAPRRISGHKRKSAEGVSSALTPVDIPIEQAQQQGVALKSAEEDEDWHADDAVYFHNAQSPAAKAQEAEEHKQEEEVTAMEEEDPVITAPVVSSGAPAPVRFHFKPDSALAHVSAMLSAQAANSSAPLIPPPVATQVVAPSTPAKSYAAALSGGGGLAGSPIGSPSHSSAVAIAAAFVRPPALTLPISSPVGAAGPSSRRTASLHMPAPLSASSNASAGSHTDRRGIHTRGRTVMDFGSGGSHGSAQGIVRGLAQKWNSIAASSVTPVRGTPVLPSRSPSTMLPLSTPTPLSAPGSATARGIGSSLFSPTASSAAKSRNTGAVAVGSKSMIVSGQKKLTASARQHAQVNTPVQQQRGATMLTSGPSMSPRAMSVACFPTSVALTTTPLQSTAAPLSGGAGSRRYLVSPMRSPSASSNNNVTEQVVGMAPVQPITAVVRVQTPVGSPSKVAMPDAAVLSPSKLPLQQEQALSPLAATYLSKVAATNAAPSSASSLKSSPTHRRQPAVGGRIAMLRASGALDMAMAHQHMASIRQLDVGSNENQ